LKDSPEGATFSTVQSEIEKYDGTRLHAEAIRAANLGYYALIWPSEVVERLRTFMGLEPRHELLVNGMEVRPG
jgi:hypothetical protein